MNKTEIKAKWLEELRNGNHQQVPGTLKGKLPDGSVGYCCLGILAEKVLGIDLKPVVINEGESVHEGPKHVYEEIKEDVIGSAWAVNTLAQMNDEGATFEEIAYVIEARWKPKTRKQ